MHAHTRLCGVREEALNQLTQSSDIPEQLMFSALRLLSDSVVAYSGSTPREGEIRYYPAILQTFWSGFESFVRHASELLLLTVPTIPGPVASFLRETETVVDPSGTIRTRTRYQSVLDRYSVFVLHAYGHRIDRGNRFWDGLIKAKALRDYYTHLDINTPRAITTGEV